MFSKIMAPVDLAHIARLERALNCATDLAAHYGAEIVLVGVTAPTPGPVAHRPEEYSAKLEELAAGLSARGGENVTAHTVVSHDPTADVDDALLHAVDDTGADLVVMASHIPGLTEYIWPSNGGKIAAHSSASVMVVRG